MIPAGWGWRPGAVIASDDAGIVAALPDLPLLSLVRDPVERNRVIVEAVRSARIGEGLAPRHLRRKYGLPPVTACALVRRVGEK